MQNRPALWTATARPRNLDPGSAAGKVWPSAENLFKPVVESVSRGADESRCADGLASRPARNLIAQQPPFPPSFGHGFELENWRAAPGCRQPENSAHATSRRLVKASTPTSWQSMTRADPPVAESLSPTTSTMSPAILRCFRLRMMTHRSPRGELPGVRGVAKTGTYGCSKYIVAVRKYSVGCPRVAWTCHSIFSYRTDVVGTPKC